MNAHDDQMDDNPKHDRRASDRVIFDKTINLGHVLTFLGFMATIFVTYQNLDKRVVVVEQATLYQAKKDEAQDVLMRDGRNEIREALKEVRASVDNLAARVEALRDKK